MRRLGISVAAIAAAVTGGLLVIALLGACGDGGGDAEPTEAAASPTPTAVEESAIPLERFHYVASLTLREQRREGSNLVLSTEGDFQSPDRHAFTYKLQYGDFVLTSDVVAIGDKIWLRAGTGVWRETEMDDPVVTDVLSAAFATIRPGFLGGPAFEQARANVRHLTSTEESVNGVLANHYQVGAPGQQFFNDLLADAQLLRNVKDLKWDLWLAQEGAWPVRLRASATITADLRVLNDLNLPAPSSWELSIDVSRPNDPTLAVAAP
jgi:hypothetical protein